MLTEFVYEIDYLFVRSYVTLRTQPQSLRLPQLLQRPLNYYKHTVTKLTAATNAADGKGWSEKIS